MKTTEERKQEAIKKAYGNEWDLLPQVAMECACNNNGWIFDAIHKPRDLSIDRHEFILNFKFRPKSLAGIESNNSWIRIEEDGSNLPKKRMESWVLDKNGRIEMFIFGKQFNYGKDSELEYVLRHFTHYQPITKPLPPLY
jgi:hypothetical protein